MVLSSLLGRLAAGAPVPVFAVAGAGAREALQDLRLQRELRLTDSPREASILLIAGEVPAELWQPLARVHDALPRPRCTVFWRMGGSKATPPSVISRALVIESDLAAAIRTIQRELLTGTRMSEPAALPDEDPAPWRGIGPYGQGGSAMTGGTPFGRPMAEVAPDRDGLRLDLLPLRVGPFFPRFPAGLVLDLKLGGDVVVEASALPNPFGGEGVELAQPPTGLEPFVRALTEPVLVSELEMARARSHLLWLADALTAHQLQAIGERVLRLAARLQPGDVGSVRGVARALPQTQVLRWSTKQVGGVAREVLAGLGLGPVARASGLMEDLRGDDPAYQALGFQPIVQEQGDAAARWRQRLNEAAQSLELAGRAEGRMTQPTGRVESSRGRIELGSGPAERLLPLLPELVQGLEWGDAVTTIVSLDIDLEEAAFVERAAPREVVG